MTLQAKWRVTFFLTIFIDLPKNPASASSNLHMCVCVVVYVGSLWDLSKRLGLPVWKSRALPDGGPKGRLARVVRCSQPAVLVLYFQMAVKQTPSGDTADPSEHVLAHLHHSRGIIYKNKLPSYCLRQEWEEVKQRDGVGWDASNSRKQFISHLHYKDPSLLPSAGAASQLQLTWDM